MSDTAHIINMLAYEGITGAKADALAWTIMHAYSPEPIEALERLIDRGWTADMVVRHMRAEDRSYHRKSNEAHIANCAAVARYLERKKKGHTE